MSLAKRKAILRASVEEFQSSGFEGTSMDRIAGRAGVSKRTVYNHFESKEALFREIFSELLDRVMRATDLPYDSDRSVRDQLLEIGHREIEVLTSAEFFGLSRVTLSTLARDPAIGRDVFDSPNRPQPGLVTWIREASDAGALIPCDPEVATCQFSALIKAFALWPQILCGEPTPNADECRQIVESAVDLFLARYSTGSV